MSKLEKTKAFIDVLKPIIVTFIIGLFGMFSYVVINIEVIDTTQFAIIIYGIFFNILILSILIRIIFKKINELENL